MKKKIKILKNHSIISDFLSFSFSKGPGWMKPGALVIVGPT